METHISELEVAKDEQFKSYYVVWKPECEKTIRGRYRGLNRTMQYGNCMPVKEKR